MRITGPLLTMAAVAAVGAGVTTANVVLTAPAERPAAVEQAAGAPALDSLLPAAGPVRYAGRSADREVSVDITVEDGRATAYVCDDAGIESWTDGPVAQEGATRLTADDDSWVEYTVRGETATGTASAGGRTWEFTAAAVPAGGSPAGPSAPVAVPEPDPGGGGY